MEKVAPTILLAEDDVVIAQMFKSYLTGEGFTVLETTDGEETLKVLFATPPEILLLDLMMPRISGFDVLEAMRQDPKLKDIPVIVFSNLGQESDIKKARDLGVKDYLIKADITPDIVVERIRKYIKWLPRKSTTLF